MDMEDRSDIDDVKPEEPIKTTHEEEAEEQGDNGPKPNFQMGSNNR